MTEQQPAAGDEHANPQSSDSPANDGQADSQSEVGDAGTDAQQASGDQQDTVIIGQQHDATAVYQAGSAGQSDPGYQQTTDGTDAAPDPAQQAGYAGYQQPQDAQYGYAYGAYQQSGYDYSGQQTGYDYSGTGYAYQGNDAYATTATQQPADPTKKQSNRALFVGLIAGLVAGLVFGIIGAAIGVAVSDGKIIGSSSSQFNPANPDTLSPRADNSVAAIARKVLPTAVTIVVRSGQEGGTGSGFVYNSSGYIITNNHVISAAASGGGSAKVTVRFQGNKQMPAEIVGRSISYDIAVLKVDANGLDAATIGNSDAVVIGDASIAIGSPLGLDGTVTSGIISALDRPVTAGGQGESSYISALQTDAPINPGNSGGPLVNAEGQVIGVNSAIATLGSSDGGQSGSIGLGFAIPINTAKRIADEIISTGRSVVPIIGVNVNMQYEGDGAQVGRVEPNSPAAKAGIKAGDVITAVDGQPVTGPADLLAVLRSFNPGDKVTLTITNPNGGGSQDVTVTLGSRQE